MKLFLLILVNFIFINNAFSQNERKRYGVIEIKFEIGSKRRITKVDVERKYDADTALTESIKRRINTSTSVDRGAKRGTYTASVSYIVDKEGNLSDVECIKDPGYGMGAISVRAVKASTKWGSGPIRAAKPTYIPPSVRSNN
jgi:hypothetical protein